MAQAVCVEKKPDHLLEIRLSELRRESGTTIDGQAAPMEFLLPSLSKTMIRSEAKLSILLFSKITLATLPFVLTLNGRLFFI